MNQRLGILVATMASLSAAVIASPTRAQAPTDLSKVIPDVLGKEERADARGMIDLDIQRRIKDFNVQHRDTWYKVKTRAQWEKYKGERIERLRQSLGEWPTPGKPNVKVTGVSIVGGAQRLCDDILNRKDWTLANEITTT